MKHTIKVVRHRGSVTQGEAGIVIDGKELFRFGDNIEMVKEGISYYGENIGGWASTVSDEKFIIGALYHPMDEQYHFSDKIKAAINGDLK